MTALVLQLQADALDPNVKISDLLRKAKVVASKLELREFKEWVELELQGYPDISGLPEYRKVYTRVKALSPSRGWVQVVIEDQDLERTISEFKVAQSIGSLEDVIGRSKNSVGYLAHSLPGAAQHVLARLTGINTEFQLHLDVSSASNVLDSVRNRVLDWSISLEKSGVTGEGMTFSGREKEAAKAMTSGNVYHIHNVGVLGDVAHSSISNNQTVNYTPEQISEIRGIVNQIDGVVSHLSDEIRESLSDDIQHIKDELQQTNPSSSRIRSAILSIRATCEGAAGNLIASGIIGLLGKVLGH